MDKIISFLFGTGWWSVWYTVLWAALAPSLGLTAWLLRAPASAMLFTLSRTTPAVMKYFQGAGLAALLWFVGLWLMFAAWWSIDGLNTPRRERTLNILLMLAVSAILHGFNLYASWKFRAR
jgi:hypothetical protein